MRICIWRRHYIFFVIFTAAFVNNVLSQPVKAPDWNTLMHHPWVDSVFNELTPTQRLAQLFMVAAFSNKNATYEDALTEYVTKNNIGGVIFMKGGPIQQARLTNRLQEKSTVPLLVSMDAEWGLVMRLDSTARFPYQMTLGAVQEPELIYETGRAIARNCKRLGVHINFAPVLDINNNPANPVINFRSFGEDREEVLWRGYEFAMGMQQEGVLAVAKHFPGHGDTDTDSHLDLPVIRHDRTRLDTMELYPFRFAAKNNFGGMMTAHLSVPAIDPTGMATSLSGKAVSDLLKNEIGFQGVIFTDALNMKGVSKDYEPGEVDKIAFIAGNDILLFSEDVPKAIEAIRSAVIDGEISREEIEQRCRKVLALKLWAGLDTYKPVSVKNLVKELNSPEDELLNLQLAEAAVTVLKNDQDVLPIKKLSDTNIAIITIGGEGKTTFEQVLEKYTRINRFNLPYNANSEEVGGLLKRLEGFDMVIAGLHSMKVYPKNNFGVPEPILQFLSEFSQLKGSVLCVFGNPYILDKISNLSTVQSLLITYQETEMMQSVAAQIIGGGLGSSGRMPVSAGGYKAGSGMNTKPSKSFGFAIPEAAGIDRAMTSQIDSIVSAAIRKKATPGCQVLVAREGNVIYQASYGYHTYDSLREVRNDDVYDIASVTKIAAAVPALMRLYDEGRFDPDAPVNMYFPELKKSNKGSLTFREILAHQAGLVSWIPFWKNTAKKNGTLKSRFYNSEKSPKYPFQVSEDLYLHRKYPAKILKQIRKSDLGEKKYLYSDLGYYLFPSIIERLSGTKYEDYLINNFYHPLGAGNITFHPLEEVSEDRIVPTEYDSIFRKRLIHGTVHDEGAALMGGMSSNAGLFSNALDLAKLMQMYLNGGDYAGHRFIQTATINEFTRCQFCDQDNRRGMGFDRPLPEPHSNGNTAKSVSQLSFGHSGFTGTFAWVDPEYDIVYVFLSNRVYPTRENKELMRLNVRTDIQEAIYQSIINPDSLP